MSTEPSLSERHIADPLSETTRKERRALLAVSGIVYAIAVGELVPTTVSSLGITLSIAQQQTVLYLLVLLVGYFLWAFIQYALADLTAWQADLLRFKWEFARVAVDELEQEIHGEVSNRNEAERGEAQKWERTRLAYRRRTFFEFVVPIVISVVTILIALARASFWQR